jgi:SNF2 family DNA or RNA helicase
MLYYTDANKLFYWAGTPQKAISAGFQWDNSLNYYSSPSIYLAMKLYMYADITARTLLDRIIVRLNLSSAQQSDCTYPIPVPDGEAYLPFQDAGIRFMAHQLRNGIPAVLCADEPGLGKSVQAIGIANYLGYSRLLVISPASLRLMWRNVITQWHVYNQGVKAITTGTDEPVPEKTNIVSYELAHRVQDLVTDIVIIDEGHRLGNAQTKRTRIVLGSYRGFRGLTHGRPTVVLSGTPYPNGKPHQGYPLLSQCVPQIIDGLNYKKFIDKFCTYIIDDNGEYYITGAKNEEELYIRLRGSGFMCRRLKKDVLKDLPAIWYKLVVLPETRDTARVVEKEEPFTEKEIRPLGILPGQVSPELRREMGEALAPQCIQYIADMIKSGTKKILVEVYHRSVAIIMYTGLLEHNPLMITGKTPINKRQAIVDKFQTDPTHKVFIGNIQAAGEGYTLTQAHDVVLCEPSYVPGENTQFIERTHRIGQKNNVTAHLLVAENSMGARILASAARKANNVDAILDNK